MKTKQYLFLSVLLSLVLSFVSCTSVVKNEDEKKITDIALELSANYARKGEYEKALTVLESAEPLSSDIRIRQNIILIYKHLEQYDKAIDTINRLYENSPQSVYSIRDAIEIAEKISDINTARKYYQILFDRDLVNVKDLIGLLLKAKENNDTATAEKIANYAIKRSIYNKELFTLLGEITGNDAYSEVLKYYK